MHRPQTVGHRRRRRPWQVGKELSAVGLAYDFSVSSGDLYLHWSLWRPHRSRSASWKTNN